MAEVPSNIVVANTSSHGSDVSSNDVNEDVHDLEIEAPSETVHSQQLEGMPPLRREKKKSGGAGAQSRRKLKRKLEAIAAGRSPSRPGKKMIVNPQMPKTNDGGPGGPALPS